MRRPSCADVVSPWRLATVLAAALLAFGPAVATPRLLVATDRQCAISMENTTAPDPSAREGGVAALMGSVLTSGADVAVSVALDFVKAQLDPSQGQYFAKAVLAVDGLFDTRMHNPALSCIMVAVYDKAEPGTAVLPIERTGDFARLPIEGTVFFNLPIGERLQRVFPGMSATPVLYFEALRRVAPDSSGHYYQPVYAYAARMLRPHWLSSDPVWEVTIKWRGVSGDNLGNWSYSFGGKVPLELGKGDLLGLTSGWSLAPKLPEKPGRIDVVLPFVIDVEVTEHRSSTTFSKALQKAVGDNEAGIKQAARDAYPWRKEEVAAQKKDAALKQQDEASERASAYLTTLKGYQADCASSADELARAVCGIRYAKLNRDYAGVAEDIKRFELLAPGQSLPQPSEPKK